MDAMPETPQIDFWGSTRVSRVQSGVPPNCHGAWTLDLRGSIAEPCPSHGFGRDARNNPPEAGATDRLQTFSVIHDQ